MQIYFIPQSKLFKIGILRKVDTKGWLQLKIFQPWIIFNSLICIFFYFFHGKENWEKSDLHSPKRQQFNSLDLFFCINIFSYLLNWIPIPNLYDLGEFGSNFLLYTMVNHNWTVSVYTVFTLCIEPALAATGGSSNLI